MALARKLLIAFWKYLEKGEVPDGAVEVELGKKVGKAWRQEVPTTVEVEEPKKKVKITVKRRPRQTSQAS